MVTRLRLSPPGDARARAGPPRSGRDAIARSEISNPHKIVLIVCYQTAMIWFIFDLGIGLATFVVWVVAFFGEPEAGLRARSRPWSSSETPPCSFPAGPRGRGNVVPARSTIDLAQAIDYARNYGKNRGNFGAGIKILPDLRERGPPAPLRNMPSPRMPSVRSRPASTHCGGAAGSTMPASNS